MKDSKRPKPKDQFSRGLGGRKMDVGGFRCQRSTTAPATTGEIKRFVASRDCPVCKERKRRRSGPVCNEHANRTSAECKLLHQIDRLKARIKELEAAVDRCNASS